MGRLQVDPIPLPLQLHLVCSALCPLRQPALLPALLSSSRSQFVIKYYQQYNYSEQRYFKIIPTTNILKEAGVELSFTSCMTIIIGATIVFYIYGYLALRHLNKPNKEKWN